MGPKTYKGVGETTEYPFLFYISDDTNREEFKISSGNVLRIKCLLWEQEIFKIVFIQSGEINLFLILSRLR